MAKEGITKNHLKFLYKKIKWPSGRFIPEMGKHESYNNIKKSVEEIKNTSEQKNAIFIDECLYFMINFTEPINSPNISRIVHNFDLLRITKILDEYTAKFSLRKDHYPNFLSFLERNNKYFANIRGITLEDSLSQDLLKDLNNVEIARLNLIIEFSSSISHKSDDMQKGLKSFLEKTNSGDIKTFEFIGYNVLCSLNIKRDKVVHLVEQIDGINNIEKEQKPILTKFFLQGIEQRTTKSQKSYLSQMPTSVPDDINFKELPIVAILDSGISNPNKRINEKLIDTSFDFETEQETPCKDDCGHGTFVAGRAIHGGDISKNQPVCRIIPVKIFKDHETLVSTNLCQF